MEKGRLEAFSDGVIAIIITIMVLELRVPHGDNPAALQPLIPVLISYVLSFVYLGIYWNNHHHLFQLVERVNGWILWANLHLLFWLSLIPFATGWMGENHFSAWPTALYGFILLMAALAYELLNMALIRHHGNDSALGHAIGRSFKEKISLFMYASGIVLSFVSPWLGIGFYAFVAAMWFIPDRRMEKELEG